MVLVRMELDCTFEGDADVDGERVFDVFGSFDDERVFDHDSARKASDVPNLIRQIVDVVTDLHSFA